MAHPASWQNQIPPDEAGIMRRLEDIERQMRELGPAIQSAVGPQIATLIAQQATLTAQQATLAAAVANIGTLVGQQVTGGAGAANTGGSPVGSSTSVASYASVSVAVPAGYSQAWVVAMSTATSASGVPLYLATRIGGNTGFEVPIPFATAAASGGSSHAALITGLSGGSITVDSRLRSGAAGSVYIGTAAMAIFLR